MNAMTGACGSFALIAAIGIGAAGARQETAPAEKVRRISESVIAALKDEKLGAREKRGKFESLLKDNVDWAIVSKLVLARKLKNFSDDQRKKFIEQFQGHLVHTYWKNTDAVSLEAIEVTKDRQEANGDWTVFTQFKVSGGKTAVAYRLRKVGEGAAADWKIIDVVVEDVSLVANFRSQFESLLNGDSPDRVIDMLRKKNEEAEAKYAESEGDK